MCSKYKAVKLANEMLVTEIERLEAIITDIKNTSVDDETVSKCIKALEVVNYQDNMYDLQKFRDEVVAAIDSDMPDFFIIEQVKEIVQAHKEEKQED